MVIKEMKADKIKIKYEMTSVQSAIDPSLFLELLFYFSREADLNDILFY